MSLHFQNVKQVQNGVPKECKGESKKIPKHPFNTKQIAGYLRTYLRHLNAKTHVTKFSTMLIEAATRAAALPSEST